MPLIHWGATGGELLLDVRQPEELVKESVPGAILLKDGVKVRNISGGVLSRAMLSPR